MPLLNVSKYGKEVMFGKVDQMSREEVEKRLEQLMGNVVLANKTDGLLDPGELEDEADSLENSKIDQNITIVL